MHAHKLLDIISRTISAMNTQKDDNGELIAQANHELYEELVTLDNDIRMCLHTADEVLFGKDSPLPSEQDEDL